MNHGKSIHACSSQGLFTEEDLNNLIAYEPDAHYHIEERFVYIPTKPEFHGDTGFINLPTLAEKHKTTFLLPAKKSWLKKYNWLTNNEELPPFVESFKIYLPVKDYSVVQDRTKHSKTRIKVRSSGSSCVDDNCSLRYVVPIEDNQYVTTYEQGYDPAKCPRDKEILNPYSLCDNLPYLCDTTTRVQKTSIMPIILSSWDISVSVESGDEVLAWDVPDPATDFLLIAKVKLRYTPDHDKRSRLHRRDETPYGCCTAGNHRADWKLATCQTCPGGSVTKMGGYYCEKTE